MLKDNLIRCRKSLSLTQEDIAEKVGVSRQTVAKWESGESLPDIERSRILAEVLGVSLDDLANYKPDKNMGLGVPPRGKHLFGVVTVGDKGQIVIPAKARKLFGINAGDTLVVLGDESQGMAIVKTDWFLNLADAIRGVEEHEP